MRAKTQNTEHLSWSERIQWTLIAGGTALLMAALTPPPAWAENAKFAVFSDVPHAEKIHANLLDLDAQVQQETLPLPEVATRMAMNTAGEGIQVDLVMNRVDDGVLDDLRDMGLSIQHVSPTHRRITAIIDDIAVLYDVAELDAVEMILPEYGSATQTGSVDGRASEAMFADIARTAMSLSGAGQTVGILSDSFARTSSVRDASTTPAPASAASCATASPRNPGTCPLP
ncbi:MAG: hypothetical protein ETSY1_19735 [Candidatus Entotheonella factor]|uniref:Uncharacterized protein n=1 Tax=Entotheonella factor TaxID=1429438 RepID=W4LJV5_ENTF1|nr:MAG: hypothetical protein ETSY1_19735 [Candidatus Entotheonella factor]